METPTPNPPSNGADEPKLKIYFLPNLLTAGNLFCGFVALTKIVEANIAGGDYRQIKVALGFILLACIFDLFDGRVARMGGVESPFGREFDSLADLISFGVAPAFLVHRVVLRDVFEGHRSGAGSLPRFTAVRRVSAGALQLPVGNAPARKGFSGLSHSLGRGAGGLADPVHDLVGREGIRHRQVAVLPAGPAAVSVVDDGEQREVSELQDAGFAGDPDLYEDAGGDPVPRQHPDLPREDIRVRAAGFFHGVSGLRVHSSAHSRKIRREIEEEETRTTRNPAVEAHRKPAWHSHFLPSSPPG